jgi:hypothetical protein
MEYSMRKTPAVVTWAALAQGLPESARLHFISINSLKRVLTHDLGPLPRRPCDPSFKSDFEMLCTGRPGPHLQVLAKCLVARTVGFSEPG